MRSETRQTWQADATKAKLGSAFNAGALLYAVADTVRYGDRLVAVPLSVLWSP